MSSTSFEGFPAAGLAFLRDLERNNERAWFDARKDIYRSGVDEPLRRFVAELAARLHAARVPIAPKPKNPTFRIYRDVRFSPDKRPYKTHASAALYRNGDPADAGVLYVHVDPKRPFVASGFYRPDRAVLDALRGAAYADPAALGKIVAKLAAAGDEFDVADTLVRVPPAYRDAAGSDAEPFVKLKSFLVRAPLDPKSLRSPALLDDVMRFVRSSRDFLAWGWRAIDDR